MEVVDISGESNKEAPSDNILTYAGMVSEFIRRSHYNESVSVLSHYFSAKDINKAMSRGHSVEPEVY